MVGLCFRARFAAEIIGLDYRSTGSLLLKSFILD
jgi:hypothetical protein